MYEEVRDILMNHRGANNPITAKEISSMMGFDMEDTQHMCRQIIKRTMDMFSLPVISCTRGYYIANTDEEIQSYCDNIRGRIKGMRQRMDNAVQFYNDLMADLRAGSAQ